GVGRDGEARGDRGVGEVLEEAGGSRGGREATRRMVDRPLKRSAVGRNEMGGDGCMPPSRPQVASGTSALQRPISIGEPTIFKRSINLSGNAPAHVLRE